MKFTGERFMPEIPSDWGIEHFHRYLFARELCAEKDILDVASGEGYGSSILAEVAHHVTGVDISEEAVTFAQKKYLRSNLNYCQGSATNLPFDDKTFDIVVSFETIEHLLEQESMLNEITRVLRPDGFLIISSPDKLEYTDIPKHENQFHVKELYKNEFESLLKKYFQHFLIYGQRLEYGSLIINNKKSEFVSYDKDYDSGEILLEYGLSHAMYHIAIAGNRIPLSLPNSIHKFPINNAESVRLMREHIENERNCALENLSAWKKHAEGLEKALQATQDVMNAQKDIAEKNIEGWKKHAEGLEEALEAWKTRASELEYNLKEYQESLLWKIAIRIQHLLKKFYN